MYTGMDSPVRRWRKILIFYPLISLTDFCFWESVPDVLQTVLELAPVSLFRQFPVPFSTESFEDPDSLLPADPCRPLLSAAVRSLSACVPVLRILSLFADFQSGIPAYVFLSVLRFQ